MADDVRPGVLRGRDGEEEREERGRNKKNFNRGDERREQALPRLLCVLAFSLPQKSVSSLLERRTLRVLGARRGEKEGAREKSSSRRRSFFVFFVVVVVVAASNNFFSTSFLSPFALSPLSFSHSDAHRRRPLRPRPLRHHLQAVSAPGKALERTFLFDCFSFLFLNLFETNKKKNFKKLQKP